MKFLLAFLKYLFGHSPIAANPNGVTINYSIVNVTVIASDTEQEHKKKSKQERAKANISSNLVAQPVIHNYATHSLINMKEQKWDNILADNNVQVNHLHTADYLDVYY